MKARRSPPRPVTPAYLERAALAYLERYGASAEMLRRVLVRRVETRSRLRGEDPTEALSLVEPVIERAVSSGLVDDLAFARARAARMRRRGGSQRRIAGHLASKGIDGDVAQTVLSQGEDGEDAESAAALAFVRRRRLGPFRRAAGARDPANERARDLAALARAGFGYAVSRAALDAAEEEARSA